MKNKLYALIAAVAVGITGCSAYPTLEKKVDVTGDGIEDISIYIARGPNCGTYLFIGQKDGSFVRAKEYTENSGPEYFKTDDERFYFFDGKFYVEAKKENGGEAK